MVVVFLAGVLLARRLAPLWERRPVVVGATFLMIASALCQGAGCGSRALLVAGLVLGGVGTAVHILLWAELESCLNTLRIVLYVSGSFFLGDLLGWLFQDAEGARAAVVLALLPWRRSAASTWLSRLFLERIGLPRHGGRCASPGGLWPYWAYTSSS